MLFKDYYTITLVAVALRSAWYGNGGNFTDNKGNNHSFNFNISWSLLHFKGYVDSILHNDVELRLHTFKKDKQGGPIFQHTNGQDSYLKQTLKELLSSTTW